MQQLVINDAPGSLEPSVLTAVRRRPWVLVIIASLGMLLGVLAGLRGAASVPFIATASFLVRDPASTQVFEISNSNQQERFASDQIEILRSPVVNGRALEILNSQFPEARLTLDEFNERTSIIGLPTSDVVSITFQGDSEEIAVAGANALIESLQSTLVEELVESTQDAVERIDQEVADLDQRIAQFGLDIEALLSASGQEADFQRQYSETLARFVTLQDQINRPATLLERQAQETELVVVQRQLEIMNLVRQAGINTSAVDALIQQQSLLINERAALASRRTQIEIDRELASTGIVVFSPAAFARPAEGLGPLQLGILGLIVGIGLGTLLVYFQSSGRMRFATKEQPELVLRAPLFAAVPDFSYESIATVLPVRDSPRTRAAESFRFFAASIDAATEGESRVIALVAPTVGAGKSTVAANGALAAAMDGSRVLLIDGDFGNQAVSSILVANRVGRPGLTEVISSKASIEDVVQPIRVNNGELYLLSRGSDQVVAADFFRTPAAASFFETVGEAFDLVIVDTPPLLQVAYSSTLLRYIRTALVVVNHDSEVRHLEELEGRLRLLRARILGYVYNRAPLDEALRGYEGSMNDVVGDQSFVDTRLGRR